MPKFALRYPDHTSPTASFDPPMDPLTGSPKKPVMGAMVKHIMANPQIVYTYKRSSVFQEHAYDLFLESDAQLEAYINFFNTTRGLTFELKDRLLVSLNPLDASLQWKRVQWSPDGLEWTPTPYNGEGTRWKVPALFRDTPIVSAGPAAGGGSVVSGTVTLSGGTATIAFTADELTGLFGTDTPDDSYQVAISSSGDEVLHWATKTGAGFHIFSSDSGSTSVVDWAATRE